MPAACSPPSDVVGRGDPHISCGRDGTALTQRCAIQQSVTERGTVLTVRAPDGGFRRLLVTHDGRGVVAADGAEQAVVTAIGSDTIDVRVGRDRYRLPAIVGARR